MKNQGSPPLPFPSGLCPPLSHAASISLQLGTDGFSESPRNIDPQIPTVVTGEKRRQAALPLLQMILVQLLRESGSL